MFHTERWSHHPSLTVALALTQEPTREQLVVLIGACSRGKETLGGETGGATENGGTSERYIQLVGQGQS